MGGRRAVSDAERGGGKPQGQSRRGLARRLTVQALYQWQLAGAALGDIEAQFLA
ncbi:MAG: N utilization substance protein B, partial [Algiphilus sp.]